MGILEKKSKQRLKKDKLKRIILKTIAVAGILSVGLVAPNVLGALVKLGVLPNPRRKEYISSSASKLTEKGLLKFNGKYYELTTDGKNLLRKWELVDYKINKPKKWDRKWRMIIFDIPEKKRRIRRQISTLFHQAGFYRLQDSVWIYPYDCEDILGLIKTELGVGKDVLYIIAEEIENDHHLRDHFDLN